MVFNSIFKSIKMIVLTVLTATLFISSLNENMFIHADEEITHVVVFDSDGGSEVDSQTVNDKEKAIKPDDPSKEGYSFVAWFLDNEEYDFDSSVESDITLIAQWIETVDNPISDPLLENESDHISENNTDNEKEELESIDSLSNNIVLRNNENTNNSNTFYISADGDDNNDGSEENPFATFQKAVDACEADGTVVLLSDIDVNEGTTINKNILIKSKDSQGPYIVKRVSSFNNSLFTINANSNDVEFVLENIILNDDFIKGSSNHEGIIYAPNSSNNSVIILGNKTTLKNYGGASGVRIVGNKSKLIMKAGSLITAEGNKDVNAFGAIWNQEANLIMEKDSVIDKATGVGITGAAIFSRNGNNTIDGVVSNCSSKSGDYAIINLGGGINEIGVNAKIFGNTTKHGTIYAVAGAKVTVRGEIYNNTTDNKETWTSGIYAVDNGSPSYVYIEDGAYIHNNTALLGSLSPYTSAVYANTTSYIVMNGGKIVNNNTRSGVMVRNNGHFTMNGGEISGNDTGIKIENYGSDNINGKRRVILNGGIISNNDSDVCINLGNTGYLNGSFVYLSSVITDQSLKVNFERIDSTSFLGQRFDYSTTLKTITADKSMSEIYLGNATVSAENVFKSIDEIKDGKLITTWFASSVDDVFKLNVSGLSKDDGDIYVCMIPVGADGIATQDYKIFKCNKKISGSRMSVNVDTKGNQNESGYAFAIFSKKRQYTLHYETFGGTEIEDKTKIKFEDTNLMPEITPKKENVKFVGWYMDKEFTREYKNTNSYSDIVEKEVTVLKATLYAKYEDIMHSITFKLNGGSYNGNFDDVVIECKQGSTIKILAAPEREGYIFLYWKGSEYYPNQDYIVGIKDHIFTAVWKKVTKPDTEYIIPKTGID